MTWTNTGHTSASGVNNVTTTTYDTRPTVAGRPQVAYIGISWYAGAGTPPGTPTDSHSNTWTQVLSDQAQTVVSARLYRCLNPTVGATHTVTSNASTAYQTVTFDVFECSETGVISVDGTSLSNTASDSNTNTQPGSKTASRANTLAFVFAGIGGSGSITSTTNWSGSTTLDAVDYSGGANIGAATAFKNVSTSSESPRIDWTTNVINDRGSFFEMVKGSPGGTWAVTDLVSHEVVPVDTGQTYTTFIVTGTYDSSGTTPVTVEVQIENSGGSALQAWTALTSATISSGSWHGTLQIPRGDGYKIKARAKDGGGTVFATSSAGSNVWGVGYVINEVGQSHLTQMEETVSSPPACNAAGRIFSTADSGVTATYGAATGNGNIALLNALVAATTGAGLGGTDIPFCIKRGGQGGAGWGVDGGAGAGYYNSGGVWTDATASSPWDRYKTLSNLVRSDKTTPSCISCLGGSSDAVNSHSKATITADLITVRNNINTYHGTSNSTLPWVQHVNGRSTNAGDTDAAWEACVQTDLEYIRDGVNVRQGGCLYDIGDPTTLAVNYHLDGAGYARLGARMAQSFLKLFGLAKYDGGSVSFTDAIRVAGSKDIWLRVGTDQASVLVDSSGKKDGNSLTGFEVSTDGFSSTVSIAETIFSGNFVRLRLTNPIPPSATVKVRYMYGRNPSTTKVIFDSTAPGGDSLGRSVRPTISAVPLTVRNVKRSPVGIGL